MSFGSLALMSVVLGVMVWFAIRVFQGKTIERQMIYGLVVLAVATPILFPFSFPESPSSVTQALFNSIETLPPGSNILLSYDFDPAMEPEVQPMADALTRHCFSREHKVTFMTLWATGQSQLNRTIERVIKTEFPDRPYGTTWANIGFKTGNEGVLRVISKNLRSSFPTDLNGTLLDSIPILKDITSAGDYDLIISFGGGKPGAAEWVLFVGDPANVPIGAGVAAVSAPQLYPYYPKQMVGLLGGVKGAAEYEAALKSQYPKYADVSMSGLLRMGPQTLIHVVIIYLIILGNIVYFRNRAKGVK